MFFDTIRSVCLLRQEVHNINVVLTNARIASVRCSSATEAKREIYGLILQDNYCCSCHAVYIADVRVCVCVDRQRSYQRWAIYRGLYECCLICQYTHSHNLKYRFFAPFVEHISHRREKHELVHTIENVRKSNMYATGPGGIARPNCIDIIH